MPPRRRRKKNDQKAPLAFTESPVHIIHKLPSPVYASDHPVYADVVPLDNSTLTQWVSPQFGAAPSSGVQTRRMRQCSGQPSTRQGPAPSHTHPQVSGRYTALKMLGEHLTLPELSDSSDNEILLDSPKETANDCDKSQNNRRRSNVSNSDCAESERHASCGSTPNNYTPIRPLYKGHTTGRKKQSRTRKSAVTAKINAHRKSRDVILEESGSNTKCHDKVSTDVADTRQGMLSRLSPSGSPGFTQIRPIQKNNPTKRLFVDDSFSEQCDKSPSTRISERSSIGNVHDLDISTPVQDNLDLEENRQSRGNRRSSSRVKRHAEIFSELMNSNKVATNNVPPKILAWDTPESEYGKSFRSRQLRERYH